jgi:hypothetical protein
LQPRRDFNRCGLGVAAAASHQIFLSIGLGAP